MKYFLLDTSAIIHLYYSEEKLTKKVAELISRKLSEDAFLYMPNFCIAETFNVFGKLRYRERKKSQEEYEEIKGSFKDLVRGRSIIYSYELSRYHVLNIDLLVPFEQTFTRINKKALSTFDLLVIAMGIELVKIHGDRDFYIITAEKRMDLLCKNLRRLSLRTRRQFNISDDVVYPKSLYLHTDSIPK
ncbi:MAG: PIN domain-containing protein [Candidatus Omnitrophica bacterium]|nr:PIN domain-containing protein [Candidatus Omnitrophota bacterium]